MQRFFKKFHFWTYLMKNRNPSCDNISIHIDRHQTLDNLYYELISYRFIRIQINAIRSTVWIYIRNNENHHFDVFCKLFLLAYTAFRSTWLSYGLSSYKRNSLLALKRREWLCSQYLLQGKHQLCREHKRRFKD